MSEAEAILWFATTAFIGGAVCYLVRALLGEAVQVRRRAPDGTKRRKRPARGPISKLLLALSGCMFALSVASLLGALAVRSWFDFGYGLNTGGADRLAAAIASGLMLPAFVLLAIGTLGDRGKGGGRCPRCWYAMPEGGDRCPECGRDIGDPADLHRSRRRRWPFVTAAVFTVVAVFVATHLPRVGWAGPLGAVPTSALALGWQFLPEKVITNDWTDGSLASRIERSQSVTPGLRWWLTASLREPRSPDRAARAVSLLVTIDEASSRTIMTDDLLASIGAYLLSQPATLPPAELDDLAFVASFWSDWGGTLTFEEQRDLLAGVASGVKPPAHQMILFYADAFASQEDAEELWSAFENATFRLGDSWSWTSLAGTLGRVAAANPDHLDRLESEIEHASPLRRAMAFRALQVAAAAADAELGWSSASIARVEISVNRLIADPEPRIRELAWHTAFSQFGGDDGLMHQLAGVLRAENSGLSVSDRMKLLDTVPSWDVHPAIDEALTGLLAHPDEGLAERSARVLRSSIFQSRTAPATFLDGVQATLQSLDPARRELFADLESAVSFARQRFEDAER